MKTKANSILVMTIILIAILVVINLVSSLFYFRLDFSKGRLFKLGKASRDAVSGLTENMIVKVYASKDLPNSLLGINRYLKDLLAEYQQHSKRKFDFEYVSNTTTEVFNAQAQATGLKFIVYQTYDEQDQVAYKQAIFGLSIEYKGKITVLSINPAMESKLEYEITSRIQQITETGLPVVAVFADSTYQSMKADYFEESMERNYKVFQTDLTSYPNGAEALVFVGVLDSLSNLQLLNLDQYMMRGGKVVFLQERITPDAYGLNEIPSNIFRFLDHYGLRVMPNVVLDYVCDYRTGISSAMRSPYPVHPIVKGSDKNIITRNMNNIVLYLASQIEFSGDPGKLTFEPILQTSYNSALLAGPNFFPDMRLFQNPTPEMFPLTSLTVGALIKGKQRSFFQGTDLQKLPNFIAENDSVSIVLFSDSEIIVNPDKEQYLNRYNIVLNAIDYLIGKNSMISIRSRSIESSEFDIRKYLENKQAGSVFINEKEQLLKQHIKLSIITIPILLLALFGLLVYIHQYRNKQQIRQMYEKK